VDRAFLVAAALGVLAASGARLLLERQRSGRRLVRLLHGAESTLVALLLAAMLALSFLQIVLRNVAETGFVWIDPLLRHLVLWIGFTGALLATRLRRHINVDAVSRLIPERVRRPAHAVLEILAAGICLLLADACLRMVQEEAAAATTSFLDLPTWIVQSIMPVALLGMSYRFLRHGLGALLGHPDEEPVPELPA
jgi:TRAP-type C4-dicarboxylate transport system permease small subunit